MSNSGICLLDMPEELLEKIASYFTYDDLSHLRLVCKKFDRCCQRLLNHGFLKVDRYHAQCLRNVKAQLPRRESERRNHPLARHCDILTAIETRLSLLGMTFMKYVDMNLCCFIPGKVIDEIYRVLRYIQNTPTPPRAHEILQELRDISSMAMEYFDEKIAPALKQKIGNTSPTISVTAHGAYTIPASYGTVSRPLSRKVGVQQEISRIHLYIKQLNAANVTVKKELAEIKAKMSEQKKKIQEQEKRILEQNRIIAEQGARIAEQEGKINEVNRKLLENDRQFADMAELSRPREDNINSNITQSFISNLPDQGMDSNTSTKCRKPSLVSQLSCRENKKWSQHTPTLKRPVSSTRSKRLSKRQKKYKE
ncbi:F-box only protein 28 isoform X2 [Centruroides vittatus]|uniref:F-box only protein 28 isoform X2 n=1 Tax=Centruroides vittatus TaxID=120091 RepID=UPI00350EB3A1